MPPRPAAAVAALPPYPMADLGEGAAVSLAQNESAEPPSRAALAAARAALAEPARYPDPAWRRLRAALARAHGVAEAQILCGAGSMELIAALARAFLGPGDAALIPAHGYAFFATAARLAGAHVVTAPERALQVDPAAMAAALTPEVRVAFVADPGNPTGTRIGRAGLAALRAALPGDVLLVIDEAYAEFAGGPPCFDLVGRGDTVVLRSFSKAYGLAGLRAGWGLFPPEIARAVRRALPPNNLSAPAEAAAAAATADAAALAAAVAATVARRDRFAAALRALGLDVPESHTNFVLAGFGTAEAASRADAALRRSGYAVRGLAAYGLADRLRITVGAPAHLAGVVRALAAHLGREGAACA